MAEYLDNDEDGVIDDQSVVDAMTNNKATLVMFPTFAEWENILENGNQNDLDNLFDNYSVQDCIGEETNEPNRFDAALEEVLHLIQTSGYSQVYNDLNPRGSTTALLSAVDTARGGTY